MPKSRFYTAIKKYSIQSASLAFPVSYGPNRLNKIIKKLLNDNDIDTSEVNFNFFINGEQLKTPLSKFIEEKGISEEIEEIMYDVEFEPPTFENETKTEQSVTDLRFKSKWIAAASCDLQIFESGAPEKPVVFIPMDTAVFKVDWISIDEKNNRGILITGGEWGKLSMWDCNLVDGSVTQLFDYKGHLQSITCLRVSDEKRLVASGSEDGQLKLWSSSQQISNLSDETGGIPHLSKSKNKVPTRIPLVTISAHKSEICDINWLDSALDLSNSVSDSGTGSKCGDLLTCGDDFYLKLWHVDGQGSSLVREVRANNCLRVMDTNWANQMVMTGSSDNRLRAFDLRASHAEVHNIFRAHDNCITGVKWSKVNSNVFVSTGRKGTTKLWDVRNLKAPTMVVSKFYESVFCCDWSQDGTLLAKSYGDGSLRFYKFKQ